MAELKDREKIRQELVPTLSSLLDDTLTAAGDAGCSLKSAALFGSAIGKHYVPGKSDVNIVLIFDSVGIELLKSLRDVFKKYVKKLKGRPVVVDLEFITDSVDVFPMEFYEWRDRSRVIYGENLLANVEISPENLRLQIEENLRGKRMKMAQAFFDMDPKKKQLQPFLEETLPNFITVLRNVLRLMGEPANRDAFGLIDAVEEKAGVSLSRMKRLQRMKVDEVKLGAQELEITFGGYMDELKELIVFVDKFDGTGKN